MPGIREHSNSHFVHRNPKSVAHPEPLYGSPNSESAKFRLLQEQIELAEEELALLKKQKGDALQSHNISRHQI